MRLSTILTIIIAVGSCLPLRSTAQCDPTLIPDSTQLIMDGNITASILKNNTLYIGGSFTSIGRNTGAFTAVDTTTGDVSLSKSWPRVNTGGAIYSFVPDGLGGWFIGGTFSQVGDSLRNNIAQINAAGQVTKWNPNADNTVWCLLLDNNRLYTGGDFTNIGGAARSKIASLNPTTGIATAWNPNAGNTVYAMERYGNKLYVGGSFTTIGAASRSYLAKLDTATGFSTAWNANIGTSSEIRTITGNAGSLYIGGAFTDISGISRASIAALDTATAIPTSWNPQAFGEVYKILFYSGKVYVGGDFGNIGSQTRYGLAEINITTGLASGFNPSGTSSPVVVYDLYGYANNLYIAGKFTSLGGQDNANMAKVNVATGTLTSWRCYADYTVYHIAVNGGKLFTGGQFSKAGYKARAHAAAIDLTTYTVTDWDPSPDGPINCFAEGGGHIYLAGGYYYLHGVYNPRLAMVDTFTGGLITSFACSTQYVYSMAYNGGTLYLGGNFNSINGTYRNYLGAVNSVTGALLSWDPTGGYYMSQINKILIAGANLYIAGSFSNVGPTLRNNIAAVDLFSGALSSWNPNADNAVQTLAYSNGTIYAGGNFSTIGGVFAPRLAKISAATGAVAPWSPYPDNNVSAMAQFQNTLFIGGDFGNINGTPANGLGIVDTISNTPSPWNPNIGLSYPGYTFNDLELYRNRLVVTSYLYGVRQYLIRAIADTLNISGNNNVCSGTSVTYTTATNVTGSTYKWRVNGVTKSTASTLTYVPLNGDHVQCTNYIPIGTCYTTDSSVSNMITMTVSAYTTPTVAISGPATVCAGTSVTDTVFTNISGAKYLWHVNGTLADSTVTYSYIPANGDNINCTITVPSGGCFTTTTVTSAKITMVVKPNVNPLTSVTTPATTICAGASAAFRAHSGTAGMHYQWSVNGMAAGIDDSNYVYVPVTGDQVMCVVTAPSGGCYLANPDSNIAIVMTVNPDTIPVITITGDSVMCAGKTAAFTLTSSIPTATYLWYVNTTSTGVTATSYSYKPASGDKVKCILTVPAGCYTAARDTSNIMTMIVSPNVTPVSSIVVDTNGNCMGRPAHLTGTTNITGGAYQWQTNGASVGSLKTYSYVPANSDVLKWIVTTPANSCYTRTTDTSNSITMAVTGFTKPSLIIDGPGAISDGNIVTVTATVSNAGSSYLITWYKDNAVFNTSSTPVTNFVKGTGADTITAKIESLDVGCYDTVASNTIYVYATEGIANVRGNTAIKVYPNPFMEELTLDGVKQNDHLSLYDVTGKKVYDAQYAEPGTKTSLSIKGLIHGVYMLRITDSNGLNVASFNLTKL